MFADVLVTTISCGSVGVSASRHGAAMRRDALLLVSNAAITPMYLFFAFVHSRRGDATRQSNRETCTGCTPIITVSVKLMLNMIR